MKTIKQMLMTVAVLLFSTTASAYDFEVEGIYYNILSASDFTAEVTSGDNKYSGDIIIPETVVYKSKVLKVAGIDYQAFRDCSGLTSIAIPNSITCIEGYAFYGCSGLTSIAIPNSVTSIDGYCTFDNCTGLKKVELDCAYIKRWFSGNSSIEEIIIGNNVTVIGEGAFSGCSGLTNLTIPNSVTSIWMYAFMNCSSLTNIIIGENVLNIGSDAFSRCSSLISIVIPDNVTSIGTYAFEDCSSLTNVKIGKSVTSIDYYTFKNCSSLVNVVIGNNVTEIGEYAFSGCSGLTNLTIPNSVTRIGNCAFIGCTSLKDLNLEDGVGTLNLGYQKEAYGSLQGEGLFNTCPLETLYIGRNLEYNTTKVHGYSPFCGNDALTSLTISDSVTRIGYKAFYDCLGLTNIHLLGKIPPSVGNDNFTEDQFVNITLYVPQGTLSEYQNAEVWKNFWDIREEESTVAPDVEVKKCATPIISYNDNGLDITSDTEGAEILSTITCSDVNSYNGSRIDLSATYSITAYATKPGCEDSESITATLCWIAVSDSFGEDGIIEVKAMPVLITCTDGTINIRGGKEGAEVLVYNTSGVSIGNATITNGNAVINTTLTKGEIIVVNIDGRSFKIVMQ